MTNIFFKLLITSLLSKLFRDKDLTRQQIGKKIQLFFQPWLKNDLREVYAFLRIYLFRIALLALFVVGAVGDHAHPELVGEHVHLPTGEAVHPAHPAVVAAEHPHPVYHEAPQVPLQYQYPVYPQYQQYYHPQPQLRSVYYTAQ